MNIRDTGGGGSGDHVNTPTTEWARFVWTAPDTVGGHTLAVNYTGQLEVDGVMKEPFQMSPLTYYWIELKYNKTYRARVAGIDSNYNQGPYSNWSLPYAPLKKDNQGNHGRNN